MSSLPNDHAAQLEEYRDYLGMLGRIQLDEALAGEEKVSGTYLGFWAIRFSLSCLFGT